MNTQVVKDERTGRFGENPGPSLRDSPAVWLWESARSAGAHASGVNGSVHRRHLLKGSELVLPLLLISAEGEWREERGENPELGGRGKGRSGRGGGVSLEKTRIWKVLEAEVLGG